MRTKLLIIFICFFSLEAAAGTGHKASHSSLSIASLGASFILSVPIQETRIVVYPNPAKDRIYIKGLGASRIEMMDLLGSVVLREEITGGTVSIADLKSGMYIVRIYDADGTLSLSSKLTKQ